MTCTGTPIAMPDLPDGTIDNLDAILPITIGMPGTPQTIKENLQVISQFLHLGYSISPSVASNILTLAIKGKDGNDPSAANPVRFLIGNSFYYVTGATSYTAAAGTNWHNAGGAELAANNIDFFVYAIGETGASAGIKFGHSRIPYAETMADFVNTSTDEKYIKGNWTNFNSTDKVVNIGRFRAQLSATASFNWSIPSSKVVNRPIRETDWLSWTVVYTGFSANPTDIASAYKVIGDVVIYNRHSTTHGTSNDTVFTMTFPWKFAVATINLLWIGVRDNGTNQSTPGHIQIASASSNLANLYKTLFQGAWTNTSTKNAYIPDFSARLR